MESVELLELQAPSFLASKSKLMFKHIYAFEIKVFFIKDELGEGQIHDLKSQKRL